MDLRKMMKTGEGIDQLEQNLLGLDAEFRFKCRRCGKCCIHQDMVLFNTRDIYNIARKKGMTMQQVIEAYTEIYIGRNSHRLSFICFPAVLRGPVRCWRTAGAVCMTVNLLSVRCFRWAGW